MIINKKKEEMVGQQEKRINELKENLKIITNFLIHFEKEFEVKSFNNSDGYEIIVKGYDGEKDETYNIIFSINDAGYFQIEREERE